MSSERRHAYAGCDIPDLDGRAPVASNQSVAQHREARHRVAVRVREREKTGLRGKVPDLNRLTPVVSARKPVSL